jgi:SPP1 family predicted phage head-tail adaptor
MIQAGKLDRRVTVQERTVVRDEAGGETVTWVARATVWASRRDYSNVSAREQVLANQLTPVSQVTFRIRHRSDVELTDRLVHDGVAYDIQHIAEVGRREGLDLLVKLPSE